MNTFLDLITKITNKKLSAGFTITGVTNQYFRKFLKKFNNSPDIGYNKKQVHNEPTEAYFFLIKHISKIMKIVRHVQPKFLNQASTKQLDTPTKQLDTSKNQYNLRNCKAAKKRLRVWININKLRVRMVFR